MEYLIPISLSVVDRIVAVDQQAVAIPLVTCTKLAPELSEFILPFLSRITQPNPRKNSNVAALPMCCFLSVYVT